LVPVLLPRLDFLVADGSDASVHEEKSTLAAAAVEETSDCGDGGDGNHGREDNYESLEV
jgi:hypothetical protein